MKMSKTTQTKKSEINTSWHLVDAENKVLGNLASQVASILIGKHKTNFVNYLNVGDKVVITNASKIHVHPRKLTSKVYYRHTNYPGGVKSKTYKQYFEQDPAIVIRKAVKGMLPKNKLQNERMKNLYIYMGSEHPHEGQIKK